MGAANALAAYHLYSGKIPPTSLNSLVYMALVSLDRDAEPSWWEGHEMLATRVLGRTPPSVSRHLTRAQRQEREAVLRAVERAITPLFDAGAITTTRQASGHAGRVTNVRYRLWLTGPAPDDIRRERHRQLPTETVGSKAQLPTESVGAPDGNRRTKEEEEDLKQERDNTSTALDLTDVEGADAGPDQDQVGTDAAYPRPMDKLIAEATRRRSTARSMTAAP
jgi:hypothetical protein